MNDVFNTAIRSWIIEVTGLTDVFQADQSGPDPWPTSYATFKSTAQAPNWSSDYEKVAGAVEGTIDINHVSYMPVTVTINIFDSDGSDLMTKLFNSRKLRTVRDILNPIYTFIDTMSDVRDLTGLNDTEFKPRYQADFTFHYQTKLTDTDYNIDKLSAQGTIDNDDDVTIIGWDLTTP